jgi:hypothetical protein
MMLCLYISVSMWQLPRESKSLINAGKLKHYADCYP